MAIFLRHTGCDRCGSSDALAHYSDGSEYCFSCGTTRGASAAAFIPTFAEDEDDEEVPELPKDLSHDFPRHVIEWLAPTGVTIAELIQSGYFYSNSAGGLLRVLLSEPSRDVSWHLRRRPSKSPYEIRSSFGQSKSRGPKTVFRGSKEFTDGYVLCENGYVQSLDPGQDKALCIVEDSISAIKVARHVDAVPLFGSTVSNNKLTRITKEYNKVFVWLDSDKLNNARSIADRIKLLGKQAIVIYTELDPKYTTGNPNDF